MDTKKARAFVKVTECGSITAAAQELGYTQPGLTNMMNALEAELGVTLLIRSKSGIKVSQDGFELLPSIKKLIAADEELQNYAGRLVEKNKSTLRIGAYSSITRAWLPDILSLFRQRNIGTDTAINATSVTDVYTQVKEGNLDCAVVSYQPGMIKGLAWFPLHSDRLVAVLPRDYVTEEKSFPVENFSQEDFLMPASGFDLDIMPALNAGGHQVTPNIKITNLDDPAIASMVAHNLGFTVLSELVMEGINDNVITLPLNPPAARELGIIALESRVNDKNISRFISCATQVLSDLYT